MKKSKQKKDIGLIVSVALAAALVGVFVFALCRLLGERTETKRAKEGFSEVYALVGTREPVLLAATAEPTSAPTQTAASNESSDPNATPDPLATPTPVPTPTPEPTVQPRLAALYDTNGDLFGWVTIPDTNIDYPVMYTPQSPWYYLKRDFSGNDSPAGVPFLDESCAPDDAVLLIHGHHRKDGLMFTNLVNYQKREFWESHPYVLLDTLTEQRTYAVFAAVETRIYEDWRQNVFRYEQLDVFTPEAFEAYFAQVQAIALYDTGISVSWGDEVLLLSTCAYHTSEGRFVVLAKRIDNA